MFRVLLLGVLLPGMVPFVSAGQQASEERPNILWIIAEDMGQELGVYGTPEVRTPNLDRLAGDGMLFTHAFTTSPVCSPSRSALNTGMYQTTIGAHNHRSHRPDDPSPYPFPLPEGVGLVSDWLRQAGYFTANIREMPDGVDFRGTGKTDWNFSYDGQPFDSDQWVDLASNQPFYAQINFPETHRGDQWDNAHTRIPRPADPDNVDIPPYYPDHPVVRQNWAQYLNTVMALDQKVGTVLGQLEADGLAENTVVIFMADHGRAMMRGKQWPYDSGLRIPLIIRWPSDIPAPVQYEAGGRSDRLLSHIDISATTLAAAGVPPPEDMQGRVFLGAEADPARRYVFGGRDRGDETVDRVRTVRSKRFRYIRNFYPGQPFLQTNRYKLANYETIWVMKKLYEAGKLTPVQDRFFAPERPIEELYDLQNDPHEVHNLADSSAYREILHDMRYELDRWIRSTDDRGRFPEDPEVIQFYDDKMEHLYDEELDALGRKWKVELP